jgi:hypothetical protein
MFHHKRQFNLINRETVQKTDSILAIVMLSLLSIPLIFSQGALSQEQQWSKYENPYFGIAIEHPSDWKVVINSTDASPPPPGFAKEIVELSSDTNDTGLKIQTANAESSLDTETMQLKNATLEDFVAGKKSEITNLAISGMFGDLGKLDYQMELIRDNKTTVGGLPAWKIESMNTIAGRQGTYFINTFVMKDGRLYDLEFTTDALKVPEMTPVYQSMIDSFKVTTPQAPIPTPDTSETVNSLPLPTSPFTTELESETINGNAPMVEDEDSEQSADDEENNDEDEDD